MATLIKLANDPNDHDDAAFQCPVTCIVRLYPDFPLIYILRPFIVVVWFPDCCRLLRDMMARTAGGLGRPINRFNRPNGQPVHWPFQGGTLAVMLPCFVLTRVCFIVLGWRFVVEFLLLLCYCFYSDISFIFLRDRTPLVSEWEYLPCWRFRVHRCTRAILIWYRSVIVAFSDCSWGLLWV